MRRMTTSSSKRVPGVSTRIEDRARKLAPRLNATGAHVVLPQYSPPIACSRTPWVVALITVEFDVAMPTCEAPVPSVSKNTRSPAWIVRARFTGVPTLNWSKLVRGSVTPRWAIAHCVKPEQSQEGPSPPRRYGAPSLDCARRPPSRRRRRRSEPRRRRAWGRTRLRHRAWPGPATPSTSSPLRAWKSRTAWRVSAARRRRRRGCRAREPAAPRSPEPPPRALRRRTRRGPARAW